MLLASFNVTVSVTDYERMCENKMMTKMMSKVIGCEEKQLKKFCKYINVFAENIELSPKTINNKMNVTNSINASMRRGSLNILPDDILDKIPKKLNFFDQESLPDYVLSNPNN